MAMWTSSSTSPGGWGPVNRAVDPINLVEIDPRDGESPAKISKTIAGSVCSWTPRHKGATPETSQLSGLNGPSTQIMS